MSLIFNKSSEGKNSMVFPDYFDTGVEIPDSYLNKGLDILDVSEVDVVRHYTELSLENFGVDNGMYPLGSCTMKYNPKINERLASLEEFALNHPMADDDISQGSLEVLYNLSEYLSNITGMGKFSIAPAAGSHGELAGVMIIKKYFEDKGEFRKKIIIPDTAHGTNPASVAMCGFDIVEVPSGENGDVDLDKLKELLDKDVAAMMLTSPSTLGLFDRKILEISSMLKENGSLFYGDGANLNAVAGQAKMRDMGFDIMHINLHKTFSTPHGGGGPGSGPVGVADFLVKYLPIPQVEKDGDKYKLNYDCPESIGRIHSFYGNFLVALKAYIYIRTLGPDGIKDMSDTAVLNANYLMAKLKNVYNLPKDRICMHEFVLNDEGVANHITTDDIAKRLLDMGFHAPTVYFPLLIHGAMMIEPTETESKESLDSFIDAMIQIKKESEENPEIIKNAPQNTPVRRVDAVTAARKPVLQWEK